jgi:hypothetical protein
MGRRRNPQPDRRPQLEADTDASSRRREFKEWIREQLLVVVDQRETIHAATGRLDELLAGGEPDYYLPSRLRRAVRTIDNAVGVVCLLDLLFGGSEDDREA